MSLVNRILVVANQLEDEKEVCVKCDCEGTVLIVVNGDNEDKGWLQSRLNEASYVVVADGGMRHLYEIGVIPDIVIGDMDSISAEIESWLDENDVEQMLFSAEKDETDLELAIRYALTHYDGPIRIAGATGGRVDHTLANIMLLATPTVEVRDVRIITPHQELFIIRDEVLIEGKQGDQLSLIPLNQAVFIASTIGLKWPLKNEILHFGSARGVSNIVTSHSARIVVEKGIIVAILTDKNWAR